VRRSSRGDAGLSASRMRSTLRIELDFLELKDELGLNQFEGRSWRGFHHHASMCIAAYGFLLAERGSPAEVLPSQSLPFPKSDDQEAPSTILQRHNPSSFYARGGVVWRSNSCAFSIDARLAGASTKIRREFSPAHGCQKNDIVILLGVVMPLRADCERVDQPSFFRIPENFI
jgi:hypothetical protein